MVRKEGIILVSKDVATLNSRMVKLLFQIHPCIFAYYSITLNLFSDINECDVNTDNCSQLCNNTIGSYQCYCEDGYILDSDEHTCNGIVL